MNKNEMFENIKKLHLSKQSKDLLIIMEKYKERVEFVKDGIGLRDIVFISETGVKEFEEISFYGCFNIDVKFGNDEHNYLAMSQSQIFSFDEIKRSIVDLMEKTDRTLYLWLIFKESELSSNDMFKVYEEMKNKKTRSPHEAKSKIRKYPSWFKAKFSHEVQQETILMEKLTTLEVQLKEKMIEDIMNEIDHVVESGNVERFKQLSKRFIRTYKDL